MGKKAHNTEQPDHVPDEHMEAYDRHRPATYYVVGYLPGEEVQAILIKNGQHQVIFEEYWNKVVNPELQATWLLEFAQDVYDLGHEIGAGIDVD